MTKTSRQDDDAAFRKYLSECKVDPQGCITHALDAVGDTGSMLSEIESPTVTDAEWIAELKSQIEALSDGPIMWSRSAYTPHMTQHIVFLNGLPHDPGADVEKMVAPVADLVRATLASVKAYRDTIPNEANLVWRNEPEIQRDGIYTSLRVRLCFEPVHVKVAKGVWVEERLTSNGLFN